MALPPPPPPMQPAAGRSALPSGSSISDSGAAALLQAAQAEVASLRSELYATRRSGWDAQQALVKVTTRRTAYLLDLMMIGRMRSRRMFGQQPTL